MHSLNPALYFPRTEGSVFRAAVICARCMFLRCFTVISRMSAFSSLECLELSFFRASKINVFSCPKLSLILALLLFSIMGLEDFLCSEAVLGLSGVVFMLAGVAATGDEEFFSMISAGIFSWNILRGVLKKSSFVMSSAVSLKYADTVPDMNGYPDKVSRVQLLRQ